MSTLTRRCCPVRPSVTEPNVSVHLYQAMPKADKLELIIQKAVELGVNSITRVMTRRRVSGNCM